MNIDSYEVIKCIEEIIGKDNLVSNPIITENDVLIKVKKSNQINISECGKQISKGVENFVTSAPFGVTIREL